MNAVEQALELFSSLTLEEMESHSLQDRIDTKFIFPLSLLPSLLNTLHPSYAVLRIHASALHPYETVYFDTPSLELYAAHHNDKGSRLKVRYRSYPATGLCFFEIKNKSNKDRTTKYRIAQGEVKKEIAGEAEVLLKTYSSFSGADLIPQLGVNYTRITLVSLQTAERLTFDLQLQAQRGEHRHTFGDIVVGELKQAHKMESPFLQAMKKAGVREASLSKYCQGLSMTYPGIKSNKFKQTRLLIQKFTHAR